MELKDRITGLVRALPPAQRAGLAVAAIVLVMVAVPFVRWVSAPSYTLLYAGLEDTELAEVADELDGRSVPYELEGSRVLVPQDQVHRVRADLAQAGISSNPTVPGYELLDDQALGVSDFRQQVDLQRAVEGELARTLSAMDSLESATVRLVLPEDSLFTEQREDATASVLLRPVRDLDAGQIEAVNLLVASAVEGLDPDQITIADTKGRVLHAPGDESTGGGLTDRRQRRTREYEQALSADLTQLLQQATGEASSVVVRANLDFDETEIHTEEFDEEAIALREQTTAERYEGAGMAPGGTVGVDGGPLMAGGDGNYERDDETREFGVGRTTTRVVRAPGAVDDLSVALVVSENAEVTDRQLQELVGAAAGIGGDAREEAIAITRVPPLAADEELPVDEPGLLDRLPELVALAVLALIAVGLFLMSRRRRGADTALEPAEKVVPAHLRETQSLGAAKDEDEEETREQPLPQGPTVQDEVAELVERQPEEIASLLRGWLADRRTNA